MAAAQFNVLIGFLIFFGIVFVGMLGAIIKTQQENIDAIKFLANAIKDIKPQSFKEQSYVVTVSPKQTKSR